MEEVGGYKYNERKKKWKEIKSDVIGKMEKGEVMEKEVKYKDIENKRGIKRDKNWRRRWRWVMEKRNLKKWKIGERKG